jgi:hypothetical protein
MFTGLSAFPLTPSTDDGIDEAAYARLIRRLVDAGVRSMSTTIPERLEPFHWQAPPAKCVTRSRCVERNPAGPFECR